MMPLHKHLLRQLNRLELSVEVPPHDVKKWQEFIERIDKTYKEVDQERYLLERSMELSSHEMLELNSKLENAQHIARLGYWFHDKEKNINRWSKELYGMFGLDASESPPNIDGIIELVHEKDRDEIKKLVDKAFNEGVAFEAEIRISNINKTEYKWYHIIGHPCIVKNQPIQQLTGIALDITRRKTIEVELARLQQKIITSARRAGMADVATAILHNVGNILNSANVSVHLINEYNAEISSKNLLISLQMIEENIDNLGEYFTNDPKGKLLPKYIFKVFQLIAKNQNAIFFELNNLQDQIEHIKDITALQNNLSRAKASLEEVSIPDIIESAIKMYGQSFQLSGIKIIKKLASVSPIVTDSTKVLQIVINLIQNAKDALVLNYTKENKELTIEANKLNADQIEIKVIDNGIGIPENILSKIFLFGFTTKKKGHGFGLHSSALAAKELGGKLEAKSRGLDQGATFILTLPIQVKKRIETNAPTAETTDHHY